MMGRLIVLIADGRRNEAGISFRDTGITLPEKEVGVYLEQGRSLANLIGKAKLSVHQQVVWADIELLEHVLAASQYDILYPHPLGRVDLLKDGQVEKMTIDGLGLMVNKPQDPRVGSLKQQGIKSRRKG